MFAQTTRIGSAIQTRFVGRRACVASSQSSPVYSGRVSICARIDQPSAAEISTGRKSSQMARAPAPSDLDAAAASVNAPTTNAQAAIESNANPPRL